MSGACVSVNAKEIEALAKKLNGYALSVSDERSLLHSLGVEIESQMHERLTSIKEAPDGSKWAALAMSTKKYLQIHYPGARPPLWRTGDLIDTIESQAQGSVLIAGATKEYAGYLQKGTKRMPARPFIGLSTEDVSELSQLIDLWLKERFK